MLQKGELVENRIIPGTIEEITTEWLTGALTKSGVLKNNSIRTLSRNIMGEGMGYAGTLARLSIEYEQPDDTLPSTMIAKIPTQVSKSKMLHEALWNYERENHVYEEILPHLPLRTPKCYYSDFDRGKGEKMDEQGLSTICQSSPKPGRTLLHLCRLSEPADEETIYPSAGGYQ
jgi:hypothetical protein